MGCSLSNLDNWFFPGVGGRANSRLNGPCRVPARSLQGPWRRLDPCHLVPRRFATFKKHCKTSVFWQRGVHLGCTGHYGCVLFFNVSSRWSVVPLTTKNTVKQVFSSMKMWSPRVAGGRILGRSWSVVVAYFATVLLICDTLVLVRGLAMHKNHHKTCVFEHMAPKARTFEFYNALR